MIPASRESQRRKRRVAAFACDRRPLAAAADQPRDAEPGAGPEHGDGLAVHRLAFADLDDVVLLELRYGERIGHEIVHQMQP